MLMLAGIWTSIEEAGEWRENFAIITTSANALAARIHGRMPAVLDDSHLL